MSPPEEELVSALRGGGRFRPRPGCFHVRLRDELTVTLIRQESRFPADPFHRFTLNPHVVKQQHLTFYILHGVACLTRKQI